MSGSYALEVRGVSLRFGGVRALTDVSFGVNDGELFSIIGPNGAGKTSIVNCISGRYRPTEGQLFYRGQDITALNPNARPRLGIGRTFQNLALFHHMSVLDNIMVGRHHLLKNNFITGSLYWLTGARREELEHRRKVEEIIDFLDLQSVRKATAGTLPYGLRKRVELARAMALEPQLILLDEPMAGMNFEEKEDMARYIVDLNEEFGMTVMMIEHDMGVVMDISHRVMVLDFGRKIAEGDPAAVLADPHVKRAYLGEEDEVLVDPDDAPAARGERGMMDYAGRVAQADTYPKLLRLNAREHGGEIALREKDFGLWRVFTWNDYQARVHDFALGMVELGLGRGDVIGIIGDNRPDWVSAEIATHAIGAMSLGLYRDVLDEEAAYLLSYGEAKLVFAEDEEQVDKLLTLAERVPNLKHIVYSDPRGMRKYDDPRLMEADKLAAMGRDRAAREPGLYDRLVDATRGEDVAILCTTSGTTAQSETGDARRRAGAAALRDLSRLRSQGAGRRIRLGAAAALDHGTGLRARQRPAVPDEGQLRRTARHHDERFPRDRADLRAVRAAGLGIDRRRRARRRDGFLPAQAKPLRARHEDRACRRWRAASIRRSRTCCCSARCATASALRGCARRRPAVPRSVPTPSNSSRPWACRCARCTARPNCSAPTRCIPFGQVDPDTTGVPMADNIEIRIDNPDIHGVGEIVVRHPNMFLGYYKNPEASAADMKDGWMHSGDAGYFNDDKQLVVIDRIKDLAETARGERFSPQYHREQAEILALYRRDRGARRRPRRAGGDDLHPLLDHLEMGGEEPDLVHHLYRPRLAARGLRAAAQGGRNRQRHAAAGAAHFPLPAALQGTRRRRRRTDPHPKSPPQRHQREIRRHHRRASMAASATFPSTP